MSTTPSNLRRRILGLFVSSLMLTACGAEIRPGRPDPLRAEVQDLVSELERSLRFGGWSAVEHYFSSDYRGYLNDLREHFDNQRRHKLAFDVQLMINRILQQENLINVSVSWWQRWNDLQGKPHKANGTSELILRRERGELRIIDIRRPFVSGKP